MASANRSIYNVIGRVVGMLGLIYALDMAFGSFLDTFVGKAVLVCAIIAATMDSPVAGVVLALVVIALGRRREGFSGKHEPKKPGQGGADSYDDAQSFRRLHCRDKEGRKLLVDDMGKQVNAKDAKSNFPRLDFANAECDPCDDSCDFRVTSSNERIGTEEQLRGKDSKQHIPDRKNM